MVLAQRAKMKLESCFLKDLERIDSSWVPINPGVMVQLNSLAKKFKHDNTGIVVSIDPIKGCCKVLWSETERPLIKVLDIEPSSKPLTVKFKVKKNGNPMDPC